MESIGGNLAYGDQHYCPYYCEENIWHLCRSSSLSFYPRFVLTIGNARRSAIFWSQKLSSHPDIPIRWDYHMVLIARKTGQPWVIYDFDSFCDFPSEAGQYFDRTFRSLPRQLSDCVPRFRLIRAEDFLRFFHSDRSHMRKLDGTWIHPPPKWPAIINNGGSRYGLADLIDLRQSQPGWVGNLSQLRAKLNSIGYPVE